MSGRTLAILGGSFNPPHIAHFRLGHEVKDHLDVSEVIFMPCANPPHKSDAYLLPFELRCEMLSSEIKDVPYFTLSTLESELPAPSYTVETLRALHKMHPGTNFVFILGAEDLEFFTSWHEWEEILALVDIVALPRSCNFNIEIFKTLVAKLGIDYFPDSAGLPDYVEGYRFKGGNRILYIPQPVVEISSTIIRERWHKKQSLDLFLPQKVLSILYMRKDLVEKFWSGEEFK